MNYFRNMRIARHTICSILLLCTLLLSVSRPTAQADERATVSLLVGNGTLVEDTKRLGINLGGHDRFGASQILKNFIINPGFEAGEFATIMIAAPGATAQRVQQDNWQVSWNNDSLGIGQPVDFWNGAEYEVLYGNAAGRTGHVTDFAHEDNRYTFYLDGSGAAPEAGSPIVLRQKIPMQDQPLAKADKSTVPSTSPGEQSLRLLPPDIYWRPSFQYYLDSLQRQDASAGKMLKSPFVCVTLLDGSPGLFNRFPVGIKNLPDRACLRLGKQRFPLLKQRLELLP